MAQYIPMNRRGFLALATLGIASLAVPRLDQAAHAESEGGSTMPHELPPLPYAYNALEPYYSEEILRLHHDKHHAAYVTGLNTAEEKVQAMMKSGDFAAANSLAKDQAFHGSGHILHSVFWNSMKPGGGGAPSGDLAEAINKSFGSYDAFKGLFLATSNAIQGSGWGVLAYRWLDDSLVVLGAENHEDRAQWGVKAILVLDVWEHAYYLQYQNRRPDWTKAFMDNLVNWDYVAEKYAHIKGK